MLPRRSQFISRMALAAVALSTIAFGGLATQAFAYDETSAASINVDKSHVILRGYDAVAYHTQGKAVKGVAEFKATHNGATYQFSSAANRDAFLATPAKFEPAYGGFCAMGVALGMKLDGDPEIFKVADGKLYVNVHADAAKVFNADLAANVAKAEANWPDIKDKTPASLKK